VESQTDFEDIGQTTLVVRITSRLLSRLWRKQTDQLTTHRQLAAEANNYHELW